jgi:hypothetical protein
VALVDSDQFCIARDHFHATYGIDICPWARQ